VKFAPPSPCAFVPLRSTTAQGLGEDPKTVYTIWFILPFKKLLRSASPADLTKYAVAASNKQYEFWQRDSLAVPLYTKAVALQKLTYIHNNPVAPHWQLAPSFIDYPYSSVKYYECNEKDFDFLKDLAAEF
jgi:putative transposase